MLASSYWLIRASFRSYNTFFPFFQQITAASSTPLIDAVTPSPGTPNAVSMDYEICCSKFRTSRASNFTLFPLFLRLQLWMNQWIRSRLRRSVSKTERNIKLHDSRGGVK